MQTVLLILVPLFPALCAALCWLCPALDGDKPRNRFVMVSLCASFALTAALCLTGDGAVTLFSITPSLPVTLASDSMARLFALLASAMWLNSGAFSFGYMAHEGGGKRFYTFYLLTLFAILGLAFAGTLVTMYLFFELVTLLSVALVLHSMSKEAVAAGVKYLIYSIAGAMMGLLGIFFFTGASSAPGFVAGGTLTAEAMATSGPLLLAVLFVTVVGFGTKAGMFPMHGWLPTAHPIAPAPASAVLSGVITKCGVFCIIRVVYYVAGASFLRGTWAQAALLALSLATVFMGSMMALKTTGLKKRLAYSSVSQVSYVLFGLFLLNGVAFRGALLHMVFHSVMKNALFLCAGGIILKTGHTDVGDLGGVGKRMPVTLWCFTLAGLGLVGVPPLSGFYSKWQLAQGALGSGLEVFNWLGPVVLLVSALLTAAYLLPVSIRAFFPERGDEAASLPGCELNGRMLAPLIVLTVLTLILGLCPALVEGVAAAIAGTIL